MKSANLCAQSSPPLRLSHQSPDTTPNEGTDTALKNYIGRIHKGWPWEFPFLTYLRTQHLATEVTEARTQNRLSLKKGSEDKTLHLKQKAGLDRRMFRIQTPPSLDWFSAYSKQSIRMAKTVTA